jgi:hypothetical protein
LCGCSTSETSRTITSSSTFSNQLSVGEIQLNYPDELYAPSTEEEQLIPFTDTLIGGGAVLTSQGLVSSDCALILILAAADTSVNTTNVSDVNNAYKELESTLNITNSSGFTRLSLSKESVTLGNTSAIFIDTTIEDASENHSESEALIYVLLNDNTVIGQLEFYYNPTSSSFDQTYCENIAGSLISNYTN